ncbi:MAG TPA: hypothetical protein ENJ56_05390 [Anaerolineae bacterium]|nr:hypothetical protein [Anaerolineae bacterium]
MLNKPIHHTFFRFALLPLLLALLFFSADPHATAAPATTCPSGTSEPRALLAGDSWAQYMWDDASHNDIFDKFGHADKRMISESLDSDPGPGYTGSEYAISGSEARQWINSADYPWIANMVTALNANPTVDTVVLSVGGNDVLAGRPDGGWYKDMDLDQAGAEDALFATIETNTNAIITAAQSVRPNLAVMISSYDFPNFNIGFWCFVYACPKRDALSRDPSNGLISDAELNAMMVTVEERRIGWANADSRLYFDNSVGLMHYFYGDGATAPGVLPYPGRTAPTYQPLPGGNPLKPNLRSNFRLFTGFIDADPIHLDYDGYQYKIANQTENFFFPRWRGAPSLTVRSQGGSADGWTDGSNSGTDAIRVGEDNVDNLYHGIISFDTSAIPDSATITAATLYLQREGGNGISPFSSGLLGAAQLDVMHGTFGAAAVEASDATAVATAADAGCFHGTAKDDYYAVRIDLLEEGMAAINAAGLTQFRVAFATNNPGGSDPYVAFRDGDATLPRGADRVEPITKTRLERLPDGRVIEKTATVNAIVHQGLAETEGPMPFLDITYSSTPTAVDMDANSAEINPLGLSLLALTTLLLTLGILQINSERHLKE